MKSQFYFLPLALLTVAVTIACDDDDKHIPTGEGNILLSTRIPNTSGMTGSVYTQLIENIDAGTYNNKYARPTAFATPPVVVGNDVFDLPGLTTETDIIKKYSRSGRELILQGTYTCAAGSGAISLVTLDDKAYVAMRGLGQILLLNHTTMKETGRIDLSPYGVGDGNPDPAMMLIRDGLLYVGLNQIVGGMTPDKNRAKSDMAIIDTRTDQVLKVITDSRGYSMPTNIMGDANSIFMDENKDIYINCMAGLSYLGHKGGLLRIKAGETEFDPNYEFCVTDRTFDGIDYPLDCLRDMVYGGDGVLYATASSMGYYGSHPNYSADRVVVSLEIDIRKKTIKKLDIPRGNIYATAVGKYGKSVLFGLATDTGNGFYLYDSATGETNSVPLINTIGYPFAFKVFQ